MLTVFMNSKPKLIIITLLLLSIAMGVVEFIMNAKGDVVSDSTQTLWGLLYVFLTIIWCLADAKEKKIERPFDAGLIMYLFWPILFPGYLIKTRGIEGLVYFIGFLSIWAGPWLTGLVAYVYFYTS